MRRGAINKFTIIQTCGFPRSHGRGSRDRGPSACVVPTLSQIARSGFSATPSFPECAGAPWTGDSSPVHFYSVGFAS